MNEKQEQVTEQCHQVPEWKLQYFLRVNKSLEHSFMAAVVHTSQLVSQYEGGFF